MECPNCGKDTLEIQNVLVNRTTDPNDDDRFEDMYICENCDFCEPIINESEEEENE